MISHIQRLLLLLICLVACTPKKPLVSLDPPPTPVITSISNWGVANKPYLKVLNGANPNTAITGLLRRGDIAEVLSKIGDRSGSGYWLEIQVPESSARGWVRDADMDVYDTAPQARTVRDTLLTSPQ